jgi:hypothetical protein
MKLICDLDARGFQVGNCADNVPVFHVPGRVVVGANNKDPGMVPVRCLNEIVKVQEIVMVAGQEHLRLTGTRRQVSGIWGTV